MLAQTPPMGWNSWNTFGWKDLHADVIRETIDAFVSEGLKAAGYEYVVIDDTWQASEREGGRLMWDRQRFPDGIKPLADYAHSKGLKFGIYSCAGTHTCAGKPGSYGFEEIDAQTFAEWGADFLKYDGCYIPVGTHVPTLYKRMGQALRTSGRSILFSVCEWGNNQPWLWGGQVGGQMWRTTGDIQDSWASILDIGFRKQLGLEVYAGPGGWNDPDMLVIGMHGKGNVAAGGCTDGEYRCHFGLWCLLAAPLMIGCDARHMSDLARELLLNPRLIAVNQDALGKAGYRVGQVDYAWQTMEIWAKPLLDGSIAVGLFHLGDRDAQKIPVGMGNTRSARSACLSGARFVDGRRFGRVQRQFLRRRRAARLRADPDHAQTGINAIQVLYIRKLLVIRQIYAAFDDAGIYVYQAFNPEIVRAALVKGTFGAGFALNRMTWIKPSFGWMLHRSGYASKQNQEAILKIKLSHDGFLSILRRSVETSYNPRIYASEAEWKRTLDASEVRHQWDPERRLNGYKLFRRAIQIGMRGETVRAYISQWIIGLEEVTALAHAVREAVEDKRPLPAVPDERIYSVDSELQQRLGISAD